MDARVRECPWSHLFWGEEEKVKVDPHKFLIFKYITENEEWISYITLWNHDSQSSYTFSIDCNRINQKVCYVVRPRSRGVLEKQSGFPKKIELKVTYDPAQDVDISRHSKQKFKAGGDARVDARRLEEFFAQNETYRYFQVLILEGSHKSKLNVLRRQFLLPIFSCPQTTNTDVFVFPKDHMTFNRNQGNQNCYWKNVFYLINNSNRNLHYKVLVTNPPGNCDIVIFPTKGSMQQSLSESLEEESNEESDQSRKNCVAVTVLLRHPDRCYSTGVVQKPVATIVVLYSYQKHVSSGQLEDLDQWANGYETIDIYVCDKSSSVSVRAVSARNRKLCHLAAQSSMEPVYELSKEMFKKPGVETFFDTSDIHVVPDAVSRSNSSRPARAEAASPMASSLSSNVALLSGSNADSASLASVDNLDDIVDDVQSRSQFLEHPAVGSFDEESLSNQLQPLGIGVHSVARQQGAEL